MSPREARPSRRTCPSRSAGAALVLLALAPFLGAAVVSQEFGWRRGGWRPDPIREGLPERDGVVDRGFTFCRLLYRSVRREPLGHGWNTDYPVSDRNFLTRFSQLTSVSISRWDDEVPGFAVVRATDATLFECPFLFASDVGTVGLDEVEVERLRTYLLKGGFLWVDDFWGERAWRHWADQIRRVLPEHPIVDVGLDHPLLSALYVVRRIPQVPSIQFWRRSGRTGTSERGGESAEPHLRGIFDDEGRLLVLMTHNTDVADGWEREAEDLEFFDTFSPDSYALGIDVAIWAMSH